MPKAPVSTLRALLTHPRRSEFPARRNDGMPRAFAPLAVTLTLVAGGSAAALMPTAVTIPKPPTKALPAELDVAAPYIAGTKCVAGDRPGPVAFAKLLNSTYGARTWGISRTCDGDHGEGRALDWMINANTEQGLAYGNAITRWLAAPDAQGRPGAMARRFGISYIIWNRQIWGTWDFKWKAYSGPSPHTDHIHFTFSWDGAYQQTSWWTGKALTQTRYTGPTSPVMTQPQNTTPSGYPVLRRGSIGADVMIAQRLVGAAADGEFGPATEAAVKAWQSRNGVAVTGVMDAATWAKAVAIGAVPSRAAPPATSPLTPYANTTIRRGSTGPAVTALQKALGGVSADGEFGPLTETAVRAFQQRKNLPVTGVVDPPVWKVLMGGAAPAAPKPPTTPKPPATPTTPYTAYKSTVLRVGSTGAAVRALQTGLGGIYVDGEFGPRTLAAVQAFERANRLPADGVVDRAFWDKLEVASKPLSPYYNVVIKRGSTGAAVVAAQRALRVAADGEFGPQTEAAVRAAQAKAKLTQTGVVATLTWQALERQL